MHVPNPLGGYPLVLRSKDVTSKRAGELLYDYVEDKIYYVDRHSQEVNDIAKLIYDKIIKTKLENSKIQAVRESDNVSGDEEVAPEIADRKFNTWYMVSYAKA